MRRERLSEPLAAALVLLLTAPSCRADRKPSDPVVLILDSQEVRRSDFEAYLAGLEARHGSSLDPGVREAVFDAYVERRLLVLEARAQGLLGADAGPESEQAAVHDLLVRAAGDRLAVEPAEVETYYSDHEDEFVVPETVTLRQILVATSNEARDVKRRLLKQPHAFEMLAKTLSRGPEAAQGGVMGAFVRGQLPPELEQVAFGLRPGETSGIVETSLGFHILRCDLREPERRLTLDESRSRIRTLLAARKSEREQRALVDGLLARAKVNHEAAKPRRLEES